MKKWATLLKSIVFSFLVYIWFLGSCLLIRIDSETYVTTRQILQNMEELVQNMDTHCRKHKQDEIDESESGWNKTRLNVRVPEQIVLEARKEKTVRDNLIYIPKLKQLWCLVPKAASTSWSHQIVQSLDSDSIQSSSLQKDLRNKSIPIQVTLREHFGNIGTNKYRELLQSKSVKKIILTRHPFSRIVSAYEDKLKNRRAKADSMYFYGHFGVKINRLYRRNWHSFKRKEPTFEEFIEYLLNTDPINYDEHWMPISILCGVCRVHYDHIIKQEELGTNLPYHIKTLFNETGLAETKFPMDNKSPYGQFITVSNYFQNISSSKMKQLIHRYQDDFQLFSYLK